MSLTDFAPGNDQRETDEGIDGRMKVGNVHRAKSQGATRNGRFAKIPANKPVTTFLLDKTLLLSTGLYISGHGLSSFFTFFFVALYYH